MKELFLIAVGSALVNNVVLSQFLGLCPFLGVSKNVKTSAGMGAAVIFVITIASFVISVIYKGILVNLNLEFLQTIVFILVIAALVQYVIHPAALWGAGRVPASDYDQLCRTRCGVNQRTEVLQHFRERYQRRGYFRWIYHRHRNAGWCARED